MPAQITALPTPPSTNDPANFNTRADAFLGQMPTFVTQANALAGEVNRDAAQAAAERVQTALDRSAAAASAASALNAPGTNGSSATSLTISTGTKTFTTQTGKAWAAGQGFFIASTANPLNQMSGILTAYNSGSGSATVEITTVVGSGTFSAWTIGLTAGAPMPVASQAEAEAGTDAGKVMTALRTAQAIMALGSLAPVATVTGDITLNVFGKLVPVQMSAMGKSVTLPDATTRAKLGGPLFLIDNTHGAYAVGIRDNTGRLLSAVAPGGSASLSLKANANAAGMWTVTGTGLEPGLITAEAFVSAWPTSHSLHVVLGATTTVHFASGPSGFGAFVVDASGRAISAPITISTTSGDTPRAAFRISPTSLIVFFGQSTFTTTHKAVVLSLTGASPSLDLSVGAVATFTSSGSMFGGTAWGAEDGVNAPRIAQLTSTLYLAAFAANPGPPEVFAVVISVSGATITIGSAAATGSGFQPNNAGPVIVPLTASTALICFAGSSSPQSVYAGVVSVSGVTTTWGTVVYSGMDFYMNAIPIVAGLSATKAMLVVHDTNYATVRGCVLTVAGTAVSVGSVSSILSLTGGSLSYGSDGANRFRPHLIANSVNSALFWWVVSGGYGESVVLTDNSGILTKGAIHSGLFSSGGVVSAPMYFGGNDIIYTGRVGTTSDAVLAMIGNVVVSGSSLAPERVVELSGQSPVSVTAGRLANGDLVVAAGGSNNTAVNVVRGAGSSLRSRGAITRLPAGTFQTQGAPVAVTETGAVLSLLLQSGGQRVIAMEFAS